MSLAFIQDQIEKLDPAQKASLIDFLWESLDEERIKEIEAKWAAESENRIDAFERGDLTAVDEPSAIEELRNIGLLKLTSPPTSLIITRSFTNGGDRLRQGP